MQSTSASPSSWQWDAARSAYYYWSAPEQCYIYQDGLKLDRNGAPVPQNEILRTAPNTSPELLRQDTRISYGSSNEAYTYGRSSASTDVNLGSDPSEQIVDQLGNLNLHANPLYASSAQPTTTSEADPASFSHPPLENSESGAGHGQYQTTQYPYGPQQYSPTQQYTPQPSYRGHPQQYQPSQAQFPKQNPNSRQYSTNVNTTAATYSEVQAGDPQVQQRRTLRGTPGTSEPLDPEFKVRRDQAEFFQPGRVFKVYWPEPRGETPNKKTTLTGGTETGVVVGQYGEQFYAKIRWFVVIRPGENFCSCLPIQTYNKRGVSKTGTVKWHHSIIHSSRDAPKSKSGEAANTATGERGMLEPIRVQPKNKIDKMDSMSRICYSKIYTVEHNVKVYYFGEVHKKSMPFLEYQFRTVWNFHSEEDDDEDEDDEEEGGDDNDDIEEEEDDEDSEEEQHKSKHASSSHGKRRESVSKEKERSSREEKKPKDKRKRR